MQGQRAAYARDVGVLLSLALQTQFEVPAVGDDKRLAGSSRSPPARQHQILDAALLDTGQFLEAPGQVNAQVLVLLAHRRELANQVVTLVAERVDLALDLAEARLGHSDGIGVVAHVGARRVPL